MADNEGSFRGRILVVDDEASIRESLRMILEYEGYQVEEAKNGEEAIEAVRRHVPEAILLDIKMPGLDGLSVLRRLQERGYDLPVLIVTGHGDVSTAVEATKAGAFDFFEKPLQRERVLVSLRNAVDVARLQRESEAGRPDRDEMVGSSSVMTELRGTIEKAAPTPATVLITGESGTGKELVARAIHSLSSRRDKILVQVNCAAIPEELIESELFGHEKGSFTGASKKQVGKFVAADGGTIFLDEVGDMSARTQAKVLRVLEDGDVEPVGSQKVSKVDVRVVAATNRDLKEEIGGGRFREDLYYRLNVVPIRTPPLRERLADVDDLIEYFVRRFSQASNYPPKTFSADAIEHLRSLPWQGNVRELKNAVERLLILSAGDPVSKSDVIGLLGGPAPGLSGTLAEADTLREFREVSEKMFLLRKLEENGWNVTKTAKTIDTPRSNLYKKMEQYGIHRDQRGGDGE
ncbi:MAG: sigma-54-dependent Fis family transcriptional regulator [bacterium]|nr:sigma-54-dependent Fis family transcriptional regulator [bacterium]